EVVEAARRAKAEGAIVIAITETEHNPLADVADVVVPIHSKAVYTSPVTAGYLLAAHLMLARGESSDVARRLIADLHDFPAEAARLLPSVSQEAEVLSGPLAPQYYVIAGGPQYGLGYKLGLSVIIENLWTNGSIIHAGEFYHGPIEIVEENRPTFISLLGEDPSRTAVENVVRFLTRQGTPHLVFDSRTYGAYSDLMAPFPLFMATELWVMWMAAKAGHDVDERRYMGKLSKVWGEF
ncbi:MAG: SIS domain-containing protein, partial [Clostridia bacterium]